MNDLALYTIDVSDPENPLIADVFEFDDRPFGGNSASTGAMGFENGIVYLPTSTGIRIFDVSDPADIRQIQMINLVGGTRAISYVFQGLLNAQPIANSQQQAFDVRDPAHPVAITHPAPGYFDAFDGNTAYDIRLINDGIWVSAYQLPSPDTSVLLGEFLMPFPPGFFGCGVDQTDFAAFEGTGYLNLYASFFLFEDGKCEYGPHSISRIIDLTDPANLVVIGDYEGKPLNVVNGIGIFADSYFSNSRLSLHDLVDPTQPDLLDVIRFPQSFLNLAAMNRFLLSLDNDAKAIHAIDVHQPSLPSVTEDLSPPMFPDDMVAIGTSDQYVFIATEPFRSPYTADRTLSAYRVHGNSMILTGQATRLLNSVWGRQLAASDEIACLSTGNTVQIYSVDSGSITWEAEWPTRSGGFLDSMIVQGSIAYLFVNDRCEILDLSDPSQPHMISDIYVGSDIAVVSGQLLYVLEAGTGLTIYDIENPANVFPIGSFTQWQLYGPMAVSDDLVCVAGSGRIWFINASDPSNPFKISTRQIPASTRALEIIDGFLAWSGTNKEVRLYDLQTPTDLALVASAPTLDKPFGVSSFGDLALVSDFTGGLHLFDVSDIDAPTEVGFYDTPDRAYETVVVDEGGAVLAYIADGSTGLIILDITDPGSPTLVSSLALSDLALAVAVRDGYAYLGTRFDGLQIVDVSNPAAPTLVRSVDTPGNAQSVTLDGDFAYVADGSSGVRVIDITNPALATTAGSIDTPQSARQVFVHGSVAYVPDRSTGLIALDIADPTNPQLTSTLGGLGDARSATLWGHLAFVADFDGAVHMVDVADPSDMQLLESVPTPGSPRAITSDGPRILTADGDAGLTVLEARPCWYIPCPVDTNSDGLVDFFDVQVYLAAYAASDGLADWNDDGTIDFFDLQSYLGDFTTGCP